MIQADVIEDAEGVAFNQFKVRERKLHRLFDQQMQQAQERLEHTAEAAALPAVLRANLKNVLATVQATVRDQVCRQHFQTCTVR